MDASPPDIDCEVMLCLYMVVGGIPIWDLMGGKGEKSDEGTKGEEADPVKEESPPACTKNIYKRPVFCSKIIRTMKSFSNKLHSKCG